MKSSREQFEEWFNPRKMAMQKKGISTIRIVRLHRKMLEAWQASRAAIEIEIPEITDAQYQSKHIEGGFRAEAFWLQVRKCIESAGIKVKS